jgi:hypothetical protein
MIETQRHRVIFSHPRVNPFFVEGGSLAKRNHGYISERGRLVVPTGPNQITWTYGLNTVNYQTYGGEVVQILSAYVGDLTVGGDLSNYHMMEDIYLWFMTYLSIATQGPRNAAVSESYNEIPVTMWYPMREWYFKIKPKEVPGMRIARDLTAPTWSMTAAVVETTSDVNDVTLKGAVEGLEAIHAGIGFEEPNPFSAPTKNITGFSDVQDDLDKRADIYIDIQEQFSNSDFQYLTEASSAPRIRSQKNEQTKNR